MKLFECIDRNHRLLSSGEFILRQQPFRLIKGLLSAYIAYPLAEKIEHRSILKKVFNLKGHYKKPFEERFLIAKNNLFETLTFAKTNVPYYQSLFKKTRFDPNNILKDMRYFEDLPYLTKDIIRSEGERLFARQLNTIKNFPSKTGGSTGLSCMIYYDQESLDYSAAVNLFTRERIGKYRWHEDIHFACRFPGEKDPKWPSVGDYKNFAMNRSNIFFDRLDDQGLEEIWNTLKKRRPYLIHAHPSTIYALSFYVDKIQDKTKAFEIFESSGELLQPNMREKIQDVFKCKVFNRYGLAEFGVLGYQLDQNIESMMMLDSEGWPESRLDNMKNHELVFTGFRNRLMPLIKYRTGDYGKIEHTKNGFYLKNVIGRIHDIVPLNGSMYPTHHIMDILDHRIKGVQEFQIDVRATPPILRIVLEASVNLIEHQKKIEAYWPGIFQIQYVGFNDLVRVGSRQKFRHVVSS